MPDISSDTKKNLCLAMTVTDLLALHAVDQFAGNTLNFSAAAAAADLTNEQSDLHCLSCFLSV